MRARCNASAASGDVGVSATAVKLSFCACGGLRPGQWKSPEKFLCQEYTIGSGEANFTVTVLIGWDPAARVVRSWIFDSGGGFADGTWQQRGNTWKITELGTLPDGRLSSSTSQWQPVDADTIAWSATNREIDGQAVPDVEVNFVRRK